MFSNVLSSQVKPLPAIPHTLNPAFTTPRSTHTYDIESSGGETPKSPEHIDIDSDATPEMGLRSVFGKLDTNSKPEFKAGGRTSPTKEPKERRQSWWRGMQAKMSPLGSNSNSNSNNSNNNHNSGNHNARSAKGNEYSHAAERKVEKRRRNKQQLQTAARQEDYSDSEAGETPDKASHKSTRKAVAGQRQANGPDAALPAQDKPHWMYTFFAFLNNHPTLPHILSFWAQLMLNLFLIAGIMYVLWSFWSTIRSDVDKKSSEAIAELLAEMAVCAQQYTTNRCARETRVPAMEVVCSNWEKCMNQDPRNVGRARVSAHTFAEIFNGFIEPISYKAMVSQSCLFDYDI